MILSIQTLEHYFQIKRSGKIPFLSLHNSLGFFLRSFFFALFKEQIWCVYEASIAWLCDYVIYSHRVKAKVERPTMSISRVSAYPNNTCTIYKNCMLKVVYKFTSVSREDRKQTHTNRQTNQLSPIIQSESEWAVHANLQFRRVTDQFIRLWPFPYSEAW